MIGATITRYLAARFAKTIMAIFLTMFCLMFVVYFVELLRRAGDIPQAGAGTVAWMTLLRVPATAEMILPFAVLFGSMATFVDLTRKLELVVARASGMSVWQFLLPPALVAGTIGIVSVTLYNPVSANMKMRSDQMELDLFGVEGSVRIDHGKWFRLNGVDGQAIMHAVNVRAGGLALDGISVNVYQKDGVFLERVEAARARLLAGVFVLEDARVSAPGEESRAVGSYLLATDLTPEQLASAATPPQGAPFWDLPRLGDSTRDAGLDPTGYTLQFQTLLARPLLLVAMVLVAASFSLRFLPIRRNRANHFGWRRIGLRALYRHENLFRSGWRRRHKPARRCLVACSRRKHVGCARSLAFGGRLMGLRRRRRTREHRPSVERLRSAPAVSRRVSWVLPVLVPALAAFLAAAPITARAQPLAAPPAESAQRMVVEAKELAYDERRNVVTAHGSVQIYYKGRVLEADRVIYDRNTQRVFAEGHAKLTEKDGTVAYAERFDFTDDFKNGFIESLQVESAESTHFTAPHAERTGETMTFDQGAYTACDACQDDPTKPRLWTVHAKRIIHDNDEKVIYYEDASLEIFGTPIAYLPYFWSADPSVKRKSGFLNPQMTYRQQLGFGVGLPYYWALAPDYDLTITPTGFTRQGPFLSAEFRQRMENGSYIIRAEGTHVSDPSAFTIAPYGARNERWRGSIYSNGEFALNDNWRFGWDVTALSDRYFLQDYKQYNSFLQNYFFREASSTVYLTGQGPRSYFDLRGYYFQGLSATDVQAQQPIVHPLLDYNRAFDVDPAKTFGVGGQITLDANFTSTSASIANYESIQPRTLDSVYGLYNVCQLYSPSADPYKSGCLLRGVGGNYVHATAMASWQRRIIDPLGGVWAPSPSRA